MYLYGQLVALFQLGRVDGGDDFQIVAQRMHWLPIVEVALYAQVWINGLDT